MTLEPLVGKQVVATRPPKGCEVLAFEGAIRSSKTIVSLLWWCRFIRKAPKGNLLMVGKTVDVLIRNLLEPLVEMYGAHRVTWNRGLGTADILGRRVYIMGANDAKARSKVQGLTLVGAYVDEATNLPEEYFEMLSSRLSIPGAMMILTCNPEGPKHWLLRKWLMRARWWVHDDGTFTTQADETVRIDGKDEPVIDWYRVTFILDDNVWLNRVNPSFVRSLKRSHVGVFYQRMIESKWVSADGMVYPMFVPPTSDALTSRHVITRDMLPTVQAVLNVGVDYGTNHRTRGYLLGLCLVPFSPDGVPIWGPAPQGAKLDYILVVLAEFAPDTATVGEHARLFEEWLRQVHGYGEPDWIAVDPSSAVFKGELFARGRSDVMNAHNAVVSGIQVVSSLFATDRLFIVGPDAQGIGGCPVLIEALPGYMWDTKATERGKTEPLKENDDEADALRYAVYTSRRDWRDLIPLAPLDLPDTEDEAA